MIICCVCLCGCVLSTGVPQRGHGTSCFLARHRCVFHVVRLRRLEWGAHAGRVEKGAWVAHDGAQLHGEQLAQFSGERAAEHEGSSWNHVRPEGLRLGKSL